MKYIASVHIWQTYYTHHYFYDIDSNKIYKSYTISSGMTFYGIIENDDILITYNNTNYESVEMPCIEEYKIVDTIHDVAMLINDLILEKIIDNI